MLGTGFMGKCHSNAFSRIPLMYPVAAFEPRLLVLCGRDAAKLARAAASFGFEETTTDWHDLVNDDRIDVFANCGPDPMHVEPSIAALQAGRHVICEKPLALSIEDAARMRDAARRARGQAFCVFNYRFFPAVRLARDWIEQGRLGTIYHIRIHYLQMAGHDPSLRPDQVWYSSGSSSGTLQGIGSHAIDQCRFLVGEIKSVSALVKAFNPDRAVPTEGGRGAVSDEGTAAALEFANGAIGVLECSTVATGRNNYLAWEINGSAGSVRWDLSHPNSLFACLDRDDDAALGFTEISVTQDAHPYVENWWPPGHNLGWEHGHVIQHFEFLKAMVESDSEEKGSGSFSRNGPEGASQKMNLTPFLRPYLPTFEDGYQVMRIVHAIRESSRSGNRVEIPRAST